MNDMNEEAKGEPPTSKAFRGSGGRGASEMNGGGDRDSGLGIRDSNSDLEKITVERDQYLDGWKRAKADYENLVREMNQKRSEYAEWATEQVLSDLLPALDQYDLAMQFAPSFETLPEDQKRTFKNWMIGLEAVRSLWWESAKKLGLERVRTEGAFDPCLHEAVAEEESDSVPSDQLIRVTMNGYSLKGKVIRPAKVVVSKGR
jgi:molecular chaperone GrpE